MSAYAALPRQEVALVIAGKAYLGWNSLSIERGIDMLAGAFELELALREATGEAALAVKPGDACEVVLGGSALITGFIDRAAWRIDAGNLSLTLAGRDKAADLVDCSAMNVPGSWRDVKIEKIARELASPFGVEITVPGDTGAALKRFALQQGETAWAAIERLARYRGLIAFSDGKGGVTLGNPDSGKRAGRIAEGENLVSIEHELNDSDRFAQYVVKGQASGNDDHNGKAVAQIKGEAKDREVKRARTLLIIGEEQSDAASLKKRAQWEADVRAARAETIMATVPGWFGGDGAESGPVWQPGARAECEVPSRGISGPRLIENVRLIRDGNGTRSELRLKPPGAWAQLAEREAV